MTWRSYELRPAGSAPIPPAYLERIAQSKPRLAALIHERAGLTMNQGPFGISSRLALIGAKVAEAHGAGPAYHAALLHGYWIDALAIDQPEVLTAVATAIGLDAQAFAAALADPQYDAAVQDDIDAAQHAGLSGVPAIVFGGKYLVSGAQPIAVLRQGVAAVRAEQTG